MTLSLSQRIDRLDVRIAELACWREREVRPIENWTFNGAPLRLGEAWPVVDGLHTLVAQVELTGHWPVEESWLYLDVGGESLLTYAFDGGSRQLGLDPVHRESAAPAERFTITAESVARLPFGEPIHQPRIAEARVFWRDDAVHRLHMLLKQVAEAARHLKDDPSVPYLVAAGEAAISRLDWPSATDDYLSRIAKTPLQQSVWKLPPSKPAPDTLTEVQRARAIDAHDALLGRLGELQERFPPQGKLAVSGHAHIDLAWLWPYGETRRKLRRTFSTTVNLLDDHADFLFNQSTAAYYDQVEQDDPALFERIVDAVVRGQWETLGGMWVETDANMPSGESLVRQILYGQRYFESRFGVRHRICWLPDCFGFSPALPQLLRQGGMEYFFTTKMNWSEVNRFPHDIFRWEGLDGSSVLSHSFNNPVMSYNGTVEPEVLLGTWRNFGGKAFHDESLITIGYGDGGGGPSLEMLERQEQLRHFPALPEMQPTRVEDFFDRLAQIPAETLPVWKGEMYLELHRATLTTQGRTKRLYRQAENALVTAEAVDSLAHLIGGPAPVSLEPSWRILLKNAFHDILPGSSIREAYEDAEAELAQVVAEADAALDAGLETLVAMLTTETVGDVIVAVNAGSEPRPLQLVGPDGPIAAGIELPAFSIAVHRTANLPALPPLRVGERLLENDFVRVELDEGGSIASLFDKRTQREALEGPGNELWAFPMDKPRRWDAWDMEDDYATSGEQLANVDSIEVVESTAARVGIRVSRHYRNSQIVQTYRLWANSARLEIHTELDWHDRRVLLRSHTPVAVSAEQASFECAFGVVRRPTHRNTSWQTAQFEVPGHRFADLSEPGFGVAVLNDGRYGHSARGNVLGLSLLRSPVFPDPLADEGQHSFTYALMPHDGDVTLGAVRREANALNQPMPWAGARNLRPGIVSPIALSGRPLGFGALKGAEDGNGLVLRLYEPAGARGAIGIEVPEGWSVGGPESLLEEALEEAAPSAIRPFELRSVRLVPNA